MAAPKKTKRKPGRPKGSKNKTYQPTAALSIPPHCPTCGSTHLAQVKGVKKLTRNTPGEIHGVRYTSIEWVRCQCQVCGQFVVVRHYLATKKTTTADSI